MKKIILLAMFGGMLIYGQAQIISAIVYEYNSDAGMNQVKLYSSPFRDAWPGMIIGDPGTPSITNNECSRITANDTIVLLTAPAGQVLLWKNGELIDIAGEEYGVGMSLFVHQDDIYVLWNKIYPYPYYKAYVWKNGETYCEIINQEWTYAQSMCVADSNLYVVGSSGIIGAQGSNSATLWKNGVAQHLSDTLYDSYANSIAVSDSDVYVVGCSEYLYGIDVAKMWINGVESNLTTCEQDSEANSIYVDGEDVYVVGYEAFGELTYPVLWKNGVKHQLSTQPGSAACVRVFEGDVYVGGSVWGMATIWKNGESIDEFTELYSNGAVTDIFVFPDTTSNVNDFEQPLFNAALYPNPATHHVTIDLPSNIPSAQFSLFDMYGRLLLQQQIQNGETINLPNLSSGVYLYQVDSGKGRVTGKVVVSRQPTTP